MIVLDIFIIVVAIILIAVSDKYIKKIKNQKNGMIKYIILKLISVILIFIVVILVFLFAGVIVLLFIDFRPLGSG